MKLPKKISPCPIEEAIIEVRFEPTSPSEAVFGIIYSYLKERYSDVESLPILDLPEKIRKREKNLKYKPHHKLTYQNYILQIGPRVLALSVKKEYPGWNTFYNNVNWVLDKVKESEIIGRIERNSLRYINLFDSDIFKNIDLKIILNKEAFQTDETFFKTQIRKKETRIILQIANNASFGDKKNISMIDIDVISDNPGQYSMQSNKEILDKLHLQEKKVFFPLLSENFLKSLNPIY